MLIPALEEKKTTSLRNSQYHPQWFPFVPGTGQRFRKKDWQANCILGSNIIAKLYDDASIPLDVAIHAYRGSSTLEKLKVVDKYESRKLNP